QMPQPSSTTRMTSVPPCSTSMSMRALPASTEFSSSSLTTLAGRSMTSPAAILLTTSGGNCWIRGIRGGPRRCGREAPGSIVVPQPRLLDLPLQLRLVHVQRPRRGGHVAVGVSQRLLDAVLQLPVLDDPVQRALADAEHLRRLLAVALRQRQRLLDVVALHF